MYILALEASTSSAKAMLYHCQQGVVDVLGAPYDSAICDVVTIDPQGAVDAVLDVGRKLLEKNGHPKIEVVALSSIWYHSVLYLDKNRAPLSRVLTWANTEAAPTIAKYRADGKTNNWVFQKTGNPCHSIYALWKWMHLKDHGPQELKEKVAYISSLPEYLFMQLSGGELAVSNMTASASGMLNIHTLDWDDDVLAFAGLNRSMLSKVVEPEYASTCANRRPSVWACPKGCLCWCPAGTAR